MSTLDSKLEEVKQLGSYGVTLFYGEGVGCDDHDVPPSKRNVKISFGPVGCLGEVRCFWSGSMEELLSFEFRKETPKVFANPPTEDEQKDMEKGVYCMFGTEGGVARIQDHWPSKE